MVDGKSGHLGLYSDGEILKVRPLGGRLCQHLTAGSLVTVHPHGDHLRVRHEDRQGGGLAHFGASLRDYGVTVQRVGEVRTVCGVRSHSVALTHTIRFRRGVVPLDQLVEFILDGLVGGLHIEQILPGLLLQLAEVRVLLQSGNQTLAHSMIDRASVELLRVPCMSPLIASIFSPSRLTTVSIL